MHIETHTNKLQIHTQTHISYQVFITNSASAYLTNLGFSLSDKRKFYAHSY